MAGLQKDYTVEKGIPLKCFVKRGKGKLNQPVWFIRTTGGVDIAVVYSCQRHAKTIRDSLNRHEKIRYRAFQQGEEE